jgi:transcriptional regulator with GAF, ATPase, and Fis domain
MIDDKVQIEIATDIREEWQEMANILAEVIGIPAALIMRIVEPYIQVFVSSNTEGNPYHHGDKEILFGSGLYCETVIKAREKLLVPDAIADPKWKNSPDVKLNMISYLGFPILWPDKKPFGTICVLDNKRNEYSKTIEKIMKKFGGLIESHLEMIYINQILGDKNKRLTDYLEELQHLRGIVTICGNCKSIKDDINNWHPIEDYLILHPLADFSHGICPKCMKKDFPEFTVGS